MRILFISQYCPPEVNAPAQRMMDFAKAWKAAGHEVVVITGFPNHPTGVVYKGYKLRLLQRETVDGVEVVRTYLYPAPNKGILRRCINYASFMLSAAVIGCRAVGKVDIVVATSPQLLVGVAGYFISRVKRAPFVLSVRDVWPEALTAVDVRVNGFFYWTLEKIADFLYKRADKIVTVTRGAQRVIMNHGVSQEKLALIPNGIYVDAIRPMDPPEDLRERFGGNGTVIVSYIGTHGMAQKLSTVVEAARILSDQSKIRFVLIGDGAEKEGLVRTAKSLGLENVHFLDQVSQEEALKYVAASDICLVPLRRAELFKDTIPSKMYEIMACARPIVLGVDGEARRMLESASAGIYVEPEDPEALASAVMRLADDPETRSKMGRNGCGFVLENCDKKTLASEYLSLLLSLVKSR